MRRDIAAMYLGFIAGLGWPRLYGPIWAVLDVYEGLALVTLVLAVLYVFDGLPNQ